MRLSQMRVPMWAHYESSTAATTSGLVGLRRSLASVHHAMDKTELHPLLDQCGLQFQAIGSTVLDPSRCRLASAPIGSLKHNAVSFPATGH